MIVEGMLIRALKLRALNGETIAEDAVIDCMNERGGPPPSGPLVIRNAGADAACTLLGKEIVWPLESAA